MAMVEVAKQDVIIVTGGDSGMNEFFVQPYVRSFADLSGRILVVDAPDTAYALLARKILLKHGLEAGKDYTVKPVGRGELRLKAMAQDKENAAAILNLPFTIQAEELGLKSLGSTVDMLGPYQANGAFVQRAWADSQWAAPRALHRAPTSSRCAGRCTPANREEATGMLMEKLKLSRGIAERTYRMLADPSRGLHARTRASTAKASTTCSRCAPRWKAAARPPAEAGKILRPFLLRKGARAAFQVERKAQDLFERVGARSAGPAARPTARRSASAHSARARPNTRAMSRCRGG